MKKPDNQRLNPGPGCGNRVIISLDAIQLGEYHHEESSIFHGKYDRRTSCARGWWLQHLATYFMKKTLRESLLWVMYTEVCCDICVKCKINGIKLIILETPYSNSTNFTTLTSMEAKIFGWFKTYHHLSSTIPKNSFKINDFTWLLKCKCPTLNWCPNPNLSQLSNGSSLI